jgi:RimJ/RimL family protein N-acetyltransferase
MYKIQKMTEDAADRIMNWSYPNPYSIYSFSPSQELKEELLNGEYYYVSSDVQYDIDELIGYVCYGASARIPLPEAKTFYHDVSCIDIGLGIKPEKCGDGKGAKFLAEAMAYMQNRENNRCYRLTVAAFNQRAIKVYKRLGFVEVGQFTRKSDGQLFLVMIRELE